MKIKPNPPLIRSSVNIVWSIYISLANYIIYSIITYHYANIYVDILYYLLYYLICAYTISYLELFDNSLCIVFPLKIFNRVQKWEYTKLETVRSINNTHVYDFPRIQLIFKGKWRCDWPSSTFQVYSFNKRKRILNILKSKGISIIIKSDNPKESDILL